MRPLVRSVERISKRSEFDRVFETRVAFAGARVVLHVLRDPALFRALGLVVGKRVGNAVKRNRARRRLREVYRLHRDRLPARGAHLVMVARAGCAETPFRVLEVEVLNLWARAGLCSAPVPEQAPGTPAESGRKKE